MSNREMDFYKLTAAVHRNQLKTLAQAIRQSFLDAGLDDALVTKCIKSAVVSFQASDDIDSDYTRIMEALETLKATKEHRGVDVVGRILVEYCFIRTPGERLVWPENTKKDINARKKFVEGVIPRPLMRYFLVSVRGSIPALDSFETHSMLFGPENSTYEERKQRVLSLIEDFKVSNGDNHAFHWNAVYDDERIQKIALDLIGDIRRKIKELGLDRFLRVLENYQQRDPDSDGINTMSRKFILDDAKLIDNALWEAEDALAHSISTQ